MSVLEKIVFGDTMLPQEFTIGLDNPNAEIALRLDAGGMRYDVTRRQTTACTSPLILCIGFEEDPLPGEPPVLRFQEVQSGRVLGEIRLRRRTILSIGGSHFALFAVRGSRNFCLPRTRLWAHYMEQAVSQWRRNDPPDIRMRLVEQRAAIVTFIRPHPLSLVSVGNRSRGNIFTMNLMGDLGSGYFGFALRDRRVVTDVVERAGRVAVSGLPLSRCALAYRFAAHYKNEFIDWDALPIETRPSTEFGIPVPDFATGVKELEIVQVHRLGSHRLFLARIMRDETRAGGLQACAIHGFYQCWRTRGDIAKRQASVAEDRVNKRGF